MAGVVALFLLATVYLRSLCLYCAGFYLFSVFNLVLFARYGIDKEQLDFARRYSRPSVTHLATYAVFTLAGAYGFAQFTAAKQAAQSGAVAAGIVREFYELPTVTTPSFISPFWTARATERFEDAPIRVIEYADLLCPDCLYLAQQLDTLKREFAGKINIAFQHFPLEAECNQVVEKDLHPGACDLHYMAAHEADKFLQIHDEVFANFREAKANPEWRSELAVRYGVEDALSDTTTQDLVRRIINTGMEYEKTSERYAHGIRSTPTMIINNRMIIGTLPYEQLRAIFQALIDETEEGSGRFIENWVRPGR
ncbi:MAG: thioredoxin domain-containing protein [Gemmatimonadota bacterium]|nr:MAG: thioredoxin domain-containing protein [Gemmatimonadota bacterium]